MPLPTLAGRPIGVGAGAFHTLLNRWCKVIRYTGKTTFSIVEEALKCTDPQEQTTRSERPQQQEVVSSHSKTAQVRWIWTELPKADIKEGDYVLIEEGTEYRIRSTDRWPKGTNAVYLMLEIE